jgi:hypothetical protein
MIAKEILGSFIPQASAPAWNIKTVKFSSVNNKQVKIEALKNYTL